MDFLLLIGLSSFAFLFLPVLLWSWYPLPPDSSHFTAASAVLTHHWTLAWKLSRVGASGRSHQLDMFPTVMPNVLSAVGPSWVLSALLWNTTVPRRESITAPKVPGDLTVPFPPSLLCSFGPAMLLGSSIFGHCARDRGWQWQRSCPFSSNQIGNLRAIPECSLSASSPSGCPPTLGIPLEILLRYASFLHPHRGRQTLLWDRGLGLLVSSKFSLITSPSTPPSPRAADAAKGF